MHIFSIHSIAMNPWKFNKWDVLISIYFISGMEIFIKHYVFKDVKDMSSALQKLNIATDMYEVK